MKTLFIDGTGTGHLYLFFASHPFSLQAKGASLAFIRGSPKSEDDVTDGRSVQLLLAYLSVDHEYMLFDPLDGHTHIHKISRGNLADLEETGVSRLLCLSSSDTKLLCISVSGVY